MAAIVGVIFFVVASWIWNLNPSGWLFVVIMTVINLIFLFLAILGRTSFSDVWIQIAVNAIALLLALLPSTKRAFLPPLPSKEQVQAAAGKVDAKRAAAAKAVADTAKTDLPAAAAQATAPASDTVAKAASAAIDPENLTQIEGIGPAIAAALQAAGIDSLAELAVTPPEQIRKILADAGLRADPSTWPEQASMAAAGQLEDLKAFQDQLKGGREV
jgi:predicted flap endonuclease-1-like 5' DNA nuclease